jgi:hypothetical protein
MERILIFVIAALASIAFYLQQDNNGLAQTQIKTASPVHIVSPAPAKRVLHLGSRAAELKLFAAAHNYSGKYCFLADLGMPSGQKRFFVYDMEKDSIVAAGLVAHGSCNRYFLENVSFSNEPECGCSASGKYRIGYQYKGNFGKAFKLYGLDKTNSNAFERNIVLHSYQCIPDEEVYPQPICNSLGCAMVSNNFINVVSEYITASRQPILLYIFQ